jgi:hypothetical protein
MHRFVIYLSDNSSVIWVIVLLYGSEKGRYRENSLPLELFFPSLIIIDTWDNEESGPTILISCSARFPVPCCICDPTRKNRKMSMPMHKNSKRGCTLKKKKMKPLNIKFTLIIYKAITTAEFQSILYE